jgi:hypothetical protein
MKSRISVVLVLLLVLAAFVMAQGGRFAVQLGASPDPAEAEARAIELKAKGVPAYLVKSTVAGKGTFYRVRVGNFLTQAQARKFGDDLVRRGVAPEFFVAAYETPLDGAKDTVAVTAPPKPTPVKPTPVKGAAPPPTNPAPAANPNPVISTTSTPAPAAAFARFQDPAAGYSFEYPSYWTGQPLDPKDAADQRVNAGALFKSAEDSAFLNAIWNKLDKANSPDNDNDLIVEIILKSMSSGDGTQLKETSRKVVNENGLVKTYLDLKAAFQSQGQTAPLDFMGKAVIVRASKGILLVVAFYSKDAPATSASIADRIIASVRAPE